MDYEQKYNAALEKLQEALAPTEDGCKISGLTRGCIEYIFPELKESEDEEIRKSLIRFLKSPFINENIIDKKVAPWIAWLEKQGEQPVDKIEPKFKVSDWLQYRYAEPFLVEEITEQGYCNGNSCLPFEWEDEIHLWTIQDAKDGDVLATEDGRPFIIRCMVESKNDIPSAYCGINARPNEAFIITGYSPGTSKWTNSKVHPATKEQRDLLFQKMKEAGYEWDSEKKKLKKIESKKLDADKVIEWLNDQACLGWIEDIEVDKFVDKFKRDFEI